ncbi:MAG TPA: sulfite exporter TauE/SafE family protein [Flavipsychrobacter sp.]|nr:sulfite exporter TauE/SafE family protein [Flavipsychrobacter sp.]
MNPVFITALLMGLTGSLHCAGMCGPIVLFMPFHAMKGWRKWVAVAAYHLGRISMYAAMGWIVYSFKSVFNPHWQQQVSIITGVLLLGIGLLNLAGKKILPSTQLQKVYSLWGKLISKPGILSLLVAGWINGMLPCGLVYMALSLSTAADTSFQAVGAMYVFGLGTLPMLLAVTILGHRIHSTAKQWITKAVPVLLFIFAGVFILRGLNLGIPYLSPKVIVEQQEIKASCCHKPVSIQ